jgi:hypothetical protein
VGQQVSRQLGQSGQALIMAVLVMLVLVALGGFFVALLALQANQAARDVAMIAARELAETGLQYASGRLANSPEGADWRPAQTYYDKGNGRFEITISYTPGSGDAYSSRYIRIESTGRLYKVKPAAWAATTAAQRQRQAKEIEEALDPFARRTIIGFKPIGITDYLRFVTNADERTEPSALGTRLQAKGLPYLTFLRGPIRVQGDLTWYGPVHVELSAAGVPWNVEVAGRIRHDASALGANGESLVCVEAGTQVARVFPSDSGVFTTLRGRYRDGLRADDAEGFPRWVSRFEPPDISEQRYLALTRDSGVWKQDRSDSDKWYNTGWYPNPADPNDGVAPGILIDNKDDIQFSHDYEALRENLMGLRPEYSDAPRNRLYTPPGVEVVLDPGEASDPTTARVILVRHDQGFYRPNPTASDRLGRVSSIVVPYPRNGVIYAQGNVRIRGMLPPRTFGDPQAKYYAEDNRRHFSLTVVSGGTIYIEGNIITPRTADPTLPIERDSKIALLARDSVVLNTTRFQGASLVQGRLAASGQAEDEPYEVAVDQPLEFEFALGSRLSEALAAEQKDLQMLLLHSAAPAMPPGAAVETAVQLLFNHEGLDKRDGRFDWSLCQPANPDGTPRVANPLWTHDPVSGMWFGRYYYFFSPTANTNMLNESRAIAPVQEARSLEIFDLSGDCLHPSGGRSYLVERAGPFGEPEPGVVQRLRFEVPSTSQGRYWLYNLAFQPLDIRVEALIYAQRGSWFVIPGKSFTSKTIPGAPADFPGADEPLDMRVTISGAVSESIPAPVADVAAWTALWRGSDEHFTEFTDLPGDTRPVGYAERQLEYVYDPGLCSLLDSRDASGPLLLPHLPVGAGLILFGERI